MMLRPRNSSSFNRLKSWKPSTSIRLLLIIILLLYLHESTAIIKLISSSHSTSSGWSSLQWTCVISIILLISHDYIQIWISSLLQLYRSQPTRKLTFICCIIYSIVCVILLLTSFSSHSMKFELDESHLNYHDKVSIINAVSRDKTDTIINQANVCQMIGKQFTISSQYLTNIQNALWLARGSYCAPHNVDKYIIKQIDKTLFISFTGTQVDDINDIFIDLKFFKMHKFGDYIHSGFYDRTVQYFAPDNFTYWFDNHVMNTITFDAIDEVIWTGHSLGGAVSQIMGSFFYEYCSYHVGCKNNIRSSEIITFGSPLVFNQLNRVHPNMTHIINANDLIPRILRKWEIIYSGDLFVHLCFKYIMELIAIWIFIHFAILNFDMKLNWKQLVMTCIIWFALALWLAQVLYFHIILMTLLVSIKGIILDCKKCCLYKMGSRYIDCNQHKHNLAIIKILLVIVIILFVYSMLIDVIHPEYYAHGEVMHIGFNFCRKMKATEWYERMRYGFAEDDVMDHSMNDYIKHMVQFVDENTCHYDYEWDESSVHAFSARALFPFVILSLIIYSLFKVSLTK
eukprot:127153_1